MAFPIQSPGRPLTTPQHVEGVEIAFNIGASVRNPMFPVYGETALTT